MKGLSWIAHERAIPDKDLLDKRAAIVYEYKRLEMIIIMSCAKAG